MTWILIGQYWSPTSNINSDDLNTGLWFDIFSQHHPWACSLRTRGYRGRHRCGVTLLSGKNVKVYLGLMSIQNKTGSNCMTPNILSRSKNLRKLSEWSKPKNLITCTFQAQERKMLTHMMTRMCWSARPTVTTSARTESGDQSEASIQVTWPLLTNQGRRSGDLLL